MLSVYLKPIIQERVFEKKSQSGQPTKNICVIISVHIRDATNN